MGEWVVAPLGSFLERITYGFTNPMPTAEDGPYMVTAKDINYGRILYDQARRTSLKAFNELLTDKSRPDVGDVLVTKDGTLGRIALVDRPSVCINQSVALLKPSKSILSLFLRYLLEEPNNFARMLADADGSTIKHIYITRLAKMDVAVPDLSLQDAIAEILCSLDDKIELNRRMTETLEAMAQAIFQDWFVAFGPVRRKMEGATDPVAILGGLIPDPARAVEIAALFADTLGKDGLPVGWEISTLDTMLNLAYGKALPKTARIGGGFPVYGSGGIGGTHNAALVKGPGIIVGRKGTVGSLFWEPGDFYPIDTVFFVEARPGFSLHFLWQLLRTLGLETMNTDAAVPGLNRNNAHRLEVVRASQPVLDAFNEMANLLRSRIDACEAENRTLAETRDYLLPRLMSGRVRVGDAEGMAG